MKIIEITQKNVNAYLSELIDMGDDFLHQLGEEKKRSQDQKMEIIYHMIRPGAPSHLCIALNEDAFPVGMTYFNEGSGYSCGGDYIWMNCVYVKPGFRQYGFASQIVHYVEKRARENNFTLFCCVRDPGNQQSAKLFEKAGFDQHNNVWIKKDL